jgi:endonuclease/exonuclease/phosphatase family metal-dependent hydrolase
LDTFRIANPKQPGYTWDPSENVNIRYQDEVDSKLQGGSRASGPKEVAPRRIDYIFVNRGFRGNVVRSRLVFNKIIDGVNISDHFGVLTAISLQSFE